MTWKVDSLPEDIENELNAEQSKLDAKRQKAIELMEDQQIADLLPTKGRILPAIYGGYFLDRHEGGWAIFQPSTITNDGVGQLNPVEILSERRLTLTTIWPQFIRWVDGQIPREVNATATLSSQPDATVQLTDSSC